MQASEPQDLTENDGYQEIKVHSFFMVDSLLLVYKKSDSPDPATHLPRACGTRCKRPLVQCLTPLPTLHMLTHNCTCCTLWLAVLVAEHMECIRLTFWVNTCCLHIELWFELLG